MRIAAAQYPVLRPQGWSEVEDRIADWFAKAAAAGAQLLVFPEYAAMTLTPLCGPVAELNLHRQIEALQAWREPWLELHRSLAKRFSVYALAGSMPWRVAADRYHNRAWLCTPSGRADFQDKLVMTRFEREEWSIAAGEPDVPEIGRAHV